MEYSLRKIGEILKEELNKNFKKLFNEAARNSGFESASGGFFKESDECIVILELQKSNYGNYYDLNIKTYIQGVFGIKYNISKDLVKKDIGDLFIRQPKEYNDVFNLDLSIDFEIRKNKMDLLFSEFIVPETNKTITREGIRSLIESGEFILPAIKEELRKLI